MISKQAYAYCCEDLSLIENYDKAIKDNVEIWRCHHRLEINDGYVTSAAELEMLGLYYNRPASELIFLTLRDHNILHGRNPSIEKRKRVSEQLKGKGHPQSEETRKKLSEINKGKKMSQEIKNKISSTLKGRMMSEEERKHHSECWTDERKLQVSNRFKGKHKSEETKSKMSISAKKRIMENKDYKIKQSESIKNSEKYQEAMSKRKGEKCWNNGVIEVRALECPDGFVRGKLPLSDNHKKHISDVVRGKKWWNNGQFNVRALECPDGFVPGRLKKN